MLQRIPLDAFFFSVITEVSSSFFTCTGLFDDEGWSVEKGTVTSPVETVVQVPAAHCLVALVGRRHGFNFVLYNNLTNASYPMTLKSYNLTYYQTFSGAISQAGFISYEGSFGIQYNDLYPELSDGLSATGGLGSQWIQERYPFIVGIFMPISLWDSGVPMVSNEFYANSFSSNLINYEF